jgi:hypothetical protein
MKQINLTEEQFDERFTPVKNHFYPRPEDCSFNGCIFETYGQEHEYILSIANDPIKKRNLWTIVESDTNDNLYYISGYRLVNRLGFLITEEPVESDVEITVENVIEMDN